MTNLNELLKKEHLSRTLTGRGVIVVPRKKKNCAGCSAQQLVGKKALNLIRKYVR
jgi:hypothetical protein